MDHHFLLLLLPLPPPSNIAPLSPEQPTVVVPTRFKLILYHLHPDLSLNTTRLLSPPHFRTPPPYPHTSRLSPSKARRNTVKGKVYRSGSPRATKSSPFVFIARKGNRAKTSDIYPPPLPPLGNKFPPNNVWIRERESIPHPHHCRYPMIPPQSASDERWE